jgi:uncharacterized protein YyaL (SSP411 family)
VLKLDQDVEGAFDQDLSALLGARSGRHHPLVDDKCVASSNGLAIGALAIAGRTDLARACARAWLDAKATIGELPHQVTKGRAKGSGYLDDYAYLADGLLDLFDATEEPEWRSAAEKLCEETDALFRSGDRYFATSERHEQLFGRTVPALDHSVPSALAVAARVKFRLGQYDDARRIVLSSIGWVQRTTRATHSLVLLAFEDLVQFPDASRALQTTQAEVNVTLDPREAIADEKGWAETDLVIRVPEGMHINSKDPTAKWLTPTSLRVEGVLGEASFPEGETYSGEVRIPVRLRAKKSTEEFLMRVRYQPCTESECLLPQETVVTGVVIVRE